MEIPYLCQGHYSDLYFAKSMHVSLRLPAQSYHSFHKHRMCSIIKKCRNNRISPGDFEKVATIS